VALLPGNAEDCREFQHWRSWAARAGGQADLGMDEVAIELAEIEPPAEPGVENRLTAKKGEIPRRCQPEAA
jgi:hypothetical protein